MNKRYALFTIVFLCLLALSSSLYYRTEISKEEKNTALNLKNLTETTSKALLHWIHERQGDAHIWSASKDLSARLEQYLLQPDTLKYKSLLLSRMELMLKAYDYSSVQLFDSQGQLLLSTGSKQAATEVTAHKIQQTLNKGTIERTAFYLSPSGTVCIDWVAPLFREQNHPQQPIAAVVLQVDTSHYLFPLIQDHPSFYTSQKVELYAIRGNHSLWITAPGGPKPHDLPPAFRSAFSSELPQPSSPHSSTGMAINPQGAEVLFAQSPITGTPWHLTAEVQLGEIHTPVMTMVLRVSSILVASLAVIAVILLRMFHQQQEIQRLEHEQKQFLAVQRLETLSDNLPGGFVYQLSCSPSGGYSFTYISRGCESVLGYLPEQISADASLLLMMMPSQDRKNFLAAKSDPRLAATGFSQEIPLYLPTEQKCWLLFNAYPQTTPDGRLIWDGIALDITEQKQAQETIEDSEKKLRTITNAARNGVIMIDNAGKISFWNPAAASIFGYSAKEILGKEVHAILAAPQYREPAYQAFPLWQKTGRGDAIDQTLELEAVKKEGELFPIELSLSSVQMEGKWVAIGIVKDITAQKQIELELENYRLHLEDLVTIRTKELEEAKQVAETANHAKSTFLANMSHEIRTPLNAIIGFAHLIGNQVHTPEQQSKVGKIIDSGKHLLEIINDILDLSKIEAKSMQLEERTFLVSTTLDQTSSMMRERVVEKGLDLLIEHDPRFAKLPVKGDELRLRQILVNYLGNAVKFTERGSITIRTQLAELNDENALLRFEVEDTGIGIAEGQQDKLFNAFEQAEASTVRKYGGTGLGLAISKRLAEMMGGETGIISTLGQGSTFWFTARLPLGEATELQSETNMPSSLVGLRQGARVLLVEDNEINQEVATEILERFGLSVEIADNGERACHKVTNNEYDLILMDMQMPVLDGVAATRRIRTMPGKGDIPIVAMTANAFEDDRKHCEDAGMNGFVAKPVEPDQLRLTLARWLADTSCPYPKPASEETAVTPVEVEKSASSTEHIDQETGIKFTGSQSTFQHMLGKFIEQQADLPERIGRAIQSEDFETAQRNAHSLKGVAAMLGMKELRELALSLEQLLRHHTEQKEIEIATGLHLLTTELGVVLKEANEISQSYSQENDSIDLPHLQSLVLKLHQQLTNKNPEAADTWQTIEPIFCKVLEACDYDLLKEQLEQGIYTEALITLEEIQEEYEELELLNHQG
nr:ATP-binding protein [uncultured Desulfobulbus sp.]